MEQQRDQSAMQLKMQIDKAKIIQDSQLEQMKFAHEQIMEQSRQEFEKWKIEFQESTKIVTAQISAKTTMDSALMSAESAASNKATEDLGGEVSEKEDNISKLADMHGQTMMAIQGMVENMNKPKKIIRGPDGKVQGVE